MSGSQIENCPIHQVATHVWDRWTLLILRNLVRDGPQRFQDFVDSLDGISPTTLSARLKDLQSKGLVERVVVDGYPPRTKYELTELGRQAQPMMKAIRTFGTILREQGGATKSGSED